MSKSNFFSKFLKNISNSINKLLEKNLNKLKLNNLLNLARSNKIFLTITGFIPLFSFPLNSSWRFARNI